jgi:hypothetical protein
LRAIRFMQRGMDGHRRRWAGRALAVAGLVAFWSGVALAARRYPGGYDWEYMVVSRLFSPRRDPAGFGWAAAGTVACSLCLFGWTMLLTPREGGWAVAALRAGSLCMVGASALPDWLARWGKLHEVLALGAFGALCAGIMGASYRLLTRRLEGRPGVRRGGAAALAAAAVAPVVLAGVAQLYVFYALPVLHWVNPDWRAHGVWVGWSFAFWEWVTCGVLTGYAAAIALWPWRKAGGSAPTT